jgi:5-methylcytosine-specific restriction protein A
MSFKRKGKWRSPGIGPNGKKLCCCGCGREVGKGFRSSATYNCYPEWARINDPSTIRNLVKFRDRGICAICKVEGLSWEAHHIIPVSEGGGQCGLENYQTLCIACHKIETAKLARRRAENARLVKKINS